MGALCSKPGTHRGGHRVIGTTQTLGGTTAGGESSIPPDPRRAALVAAERRQKDVRFSVATWRRPTLTLRFYRIGATKGNERGQSERRETFWPACVEELQQGT
jgi:hypothetical protein